MTRAPHIVRDAAIAFGLSVLGAVAVLTVEFAVDIAGMVWTMKRFGLPVEQTLKALAGSRAWLSIETAQLLTIFVALFWPLTSWRLPLLVSLPGSVILSAAAYLLLRIDQPIFVQVAPTLAGIGLVFVLFLRIVDWVRRKWQQPEGPQS